MKFLSPEPDWQAVKAIGLDMDGTLYDEADFIAQVYRPISLYLAGELSCEAEALYAWMLQRWREKGSSYPYIFSEAIQRFGSGGREESTEWIRHCVQLFRQFRPMLRLADTTAKWLDDAAGNYALFLVTDGQAALQQAKIDALQLSRWIAPGNTAISGCYGADCQKPSTKLLDAIELFSQGRIQPGEVVYIGDRDVDEQFAKAAGFAFIRAINRNEAG
ncbi:HAD family hydrolase [Paenibacillus cymbidii]|uniref:HAD family hydrolase n=1 Tax=Paenibacillus cymbidii TaxID=1639034 RepID=UPI00108066E8|nr:HAD family hydrolase [Paenibacillus cymbidii]